MQFHNIVPNNQTFTILALIIKLLVRPTEFYGSGEGGGGGGGGGGFCLGGYIFQKNF